MSNEQQKGSGFVPIGELADTLPGVIPSGRGMSAQARHHFTTLRQVNRLIEVSEAEPDLGFMARLLALCSLPRTNPKNRHEFKRVNDPYTLYMVAGGGNKLPYGTLPRLLLAWVCTEAVRTQSPELILGGFALGVHAEGGHLQHQRRQAHQTSESDAAAVWMHGLAALRGCARGSHAERADCPSHGVLVERAPAGRALAMGEQDRAWRGLFQRDHPLPDPDRPEHPARDEAIAARTRPVPVAHLSHVRIEAPTAAHVAAALPAVRRGPGQGER